MKVRVFVQRELDPTDGIDLNGTDYNFPVLPSLGHVLHFANAGEFTVAKVGFIQDGPSFIAAVWLDGGRAKAPIFPNAIGDRAELDRYQDLNSDVPPESMEGY